MNARTVAVALPARRRWSLASALAIAAVALAGAGSAVLAADASVSIADLAFDPSTVTVDVGDTVTWTNEDQVPHTATANGGSFDTGGLGSGESGAVTFDTAGTFPYHCTIHPQMTGAVVVQGTAPTPPPAPGATPGTTTPPTDVATAEAGGPPVDVPGGIAIVAAAAAAFALALGRIGRRALR